MKTPPFKIQTLCLLIPIVLSACGGGSGGDFGLPSVIAIGNTPYAQQEKNKNNNNEENQTDTSNESTDATDKKTDEPFMKSALGYALPIPVRNTIYGKQDSVPLNPEQIEELESNGLDQLIKRVTDYHKNEQLDSRIPPQIKDQSAYQYVKAGWVYAGFSPYVRHVSTESSTAKGLGYLYYLGQTPATAFPQTTVRYQGHWDFVSDVQKIRDTGKVAGDDFKLGGGMAFGLDSGYGDDIAATSFAEQTWGQNRPRTNHHIAEFEADFANKNLTGKLILEKKVGKFTPTETIERYTINAKINGNRFNGSAIASNTQSGNRNYNLFSKHASNRLEGGFFGQNAEELAGKFLSDDHSIFGVFAGKQTTETPAPTETRFDGKYIDISNHTGINPKQEAQNIELPNYGQLDSIILNGKRFELASTGSFLLESNQKLDNHQSIRVTSCCGDRSHVKIGLVQKSDPAPLVATESQKEAARETLQKHIDTQRQKLEEILDSVLEAERPTAEQRKKIIELAFSGYDKNSQQYKELSEKRALDRRFRSMINDGDTDLFLVEVFDKGEKYDVNNEQNLDLTAFTQYPTHITPDHSILGVFVLGERTAISDLPSGTLHYNGTWHGRINGVAQWESKAGSGTYSSKSEFEVDFTQRSITGKLTEEKGISPLFTIQGQIQGNAFVGTATSRELDLDPAKQQNKNILPAMTINQVQGAFYGPQAKELGGSFSFTQDLKDNRGRVMGGIVFDGVKGE